MKNIALYGAGGHAFAMLGVIKAIGQYRVAVIFDDNPPHIQVMDVPVKSFGADAGQYDAWCVCIGDNKSRAQVVSQLDGPFPLLVHPSVSQGPGFKAGEGSMVLAGVVLDTDVAIGRFTIVNNNATLSHNVRVGDFSHIAINVALAGGVEIGNGVLVGAGAVVLPGVKVGDSAIIGAGAVVTRDVPENAVVIGSPGKILRYE